MPDIEWITNAVKARINRRYDVDMAAMDDHVRLQALGVDSLHVVDLLLEMEPELGFDFEHLTVPPDPTLMQLSESIAATMRKPPA
jgi:acyl carrier protein